MVAWHQFAKRFNSSVGNIDFVGATQAFTNQVRNTRNANDGTHHTTGNHTGTRRSRLQQHMCATYFHFYVVWNSRVGDRNGDKVFLATSVAFATAACTSAPLASPTPTLFLRLPTTTSAWNLKRRPPFTTRATRSIAITTSSNSFGASGRYFAGHRGDRHAANGHHVVERQSEG